MQFAVTAGTFGQSSLCMQAVRASLGASTDSVTAEPGTDPNLSGATVVPRRTPPRPIVWIASALAMGSWLGSEAGLPVMPWALFTAGAGGAWVGRAHLFHCGGRPMLAPPPRPSRVLWVLLLALAGLRATGPPLEALGPGLLPEALEGVWEPESGSGGMRGTLVGATRVEGLELPAGSAQAGERLRLLPSAAPVPPARGPFTPAGEPVWVLGPDEVVRLAPPKRVFPQALLQAMAALRLELGERCNRLPDPATAGLVRALVCGDTSGLDAATLDLFTRTGVRHLLAVSGSHVGLMVMLLLGPFVALAMGCLPRRFARDWQGRVLLALLLLAYIPLSGSAAPVRRAALAVVLATLAPLFSSRGRHGGGRWPDGLSLWSLALAVECAADPRALRSISLLLSYSATLGMILGSRFLQQMLSPRAQRVQALTPAGPGRAMLAVSARAGGWMRAAFAASLLAILATLPIAWSVWGETCAAGAISTPLSMLPCALLMMGGWLFALVPALEPWIRPVLVALTQALLEMLRWIDLLPGTPCPLPLRPVPLVAAASALALAAVALQTPQWRGRAARASAFAWGVLLLPWSTAPKGLELFALDVGHGSCVAFRAPGLGTWVLDCGSRDRKRVAQLALAPLLAAWESGPPGILLTHEDRDHSGGLDWLVERRPPRIWAGALPARLGERLPHTRPRVALESGSVVLFASETTGVRLRLLRGRAATGNEGSYSALLEVDGKPILLTGDAEEEGLAELLRKERLPELELLLVPHHGSDSPWLGALLERCTPAHAWISAAWEPAAGRELDRRSIAWRSTCRGRSSGTAHQPQRESAPRP